LACVHACMHAWADTRETLKPVTNVRAVATPPWCHPDADVPA
jgi:hypothetical protein